MINKVKVFLCLHDIWSSHDWLIDELNRSN